jgi:hypothetical protein
LKLAAMEPRTEHPIENGGVPAILGFQEQKRHIDTQIAELRAMQTGKAQAPEDECRRPEGNR